MAKQFDIEREIPLAAGASIAGRYDVIARGWTFPADIEDWRQNAEKALQAAAETLQLDAGAYRVIEWDPETTFPTDKVHLFVLTTSIAYNVTPEPRRPQLEDESAIADTLPPAGEHFTTSSTAHTAPNEDVL